MEIAATSQNERTFLAPQDPQTYFLSPFSTCGYPKYLLGNGQAWLKAIHRAKSSCQLGLKLLSMGHGGTKVQVPQTTCFSLAVMWKFVVQHCQSHHAKISFTSRTPSRLSRTSLTRSLKELRADLAHESPCFFDAHMVLK